MVPAFMMKKPFEQIPFNPARWPFFYGWAILFWGIIGFLLSAPGQTTGVSAFIEPLIDQLGISRLDLSIAYGIGTFASSFLITPAGKLFDRVGARWMGFCSCLTLGLVLLLLSQTDHLAAALARVVPSAWALTGTLALLFFLLRFSGQGVLTMASRNMVMKWFDHHRGLASGISGAAISFGFSMAPALFSGIIVERGWSATWLLTGVVLIVIFSPLLLFFFRDNPEASGLVPDGTPAKGSKQKRPLSHRQFTLPEARRTFAFWAFALTMALFALVNTAFTFHIESIFEHAGMDGSQGFSIFPPIAIIAVAVTLLGGWLSDRMQLRWLLAAMLAAQCINLLGIILLAPGWPIALIILGGGIAGGLFGVLMSVTWPRYYGREHLGAISGLSMSFIVAASAIGPALYSGILNRTGHYTAGIAVCLLIALVLLVFSFLARNPQPAPMPD
jgi:MFS family permease